ncbi:DUF6268 family outer membrane beta-barrel protein [Actomonas aquatica]|uniref:DUF6268 family outer membrane beta-barrel protein n=1 Tax=Actomonas aquatica TaxID=2866162 RepID=A0ABZ1C816_9BACT|nr:DUF6268 family outer membrane beta-barrel protein [Opitutus sp. WL0086]WRQ87472.1 DUF6268 family outer membrane beta-barrel protein [Opitutus sp. WL0086]
MKTSSLRRFLSAAFATISAGAVSISAQGGPPLAAGDQEWQLLTSGIFRSSSDVDAGGDVSSNDYRIQLGGRYGLEGGRTLGASLEYQLFDYDFSTPGGWSEIERLDLGLSYSHPLSRTSSLFASPSVGFAAESGGLDSDSLTYGGIFGYSRQVDSTLTLGIGAGVFFGLEDTSGFPVVLVRWQINDDWRLGNPFRPGPAGPAGLELVYTGFESWELGFGASYRSERFKLDDGNPATASYGEDKGVATFLRASRPLGPGSHLNLYLGTIVGGELTWDDASGHTLARSDYDPSFLAALAFTASF